MPAKKTKAAKPAMPKSATVVIDTFQLVKGIKRVMHATAKTSNGQPDYSRPALAGVLIEVKGDMLAVVAADGWQMASAVMRHNGTTDQPAGKLQFTAPLSVAKAIAESSFNSKYARLHFNELARTDNVTSTTDTALSLVIEAEFNYGYKKLSKAAAERKALIDGVSIAAVVATRWPDWERIAPTSAPIYAVEVEAGRLSARILAGISNVELTFRRMSGSSVLALDYRYNIDVLVDDKPVYAWLAGELHDVVKAISVHPSAGDTMKYDFNADLMRPWLGTVPSACTVKLCAWPAPDGGRPLVLSYSDNDGIEYTGIVMPLNYGRNASFM